jgi:leucyl/phenylalanyl-tRNA--protein transferase
MADHDGMIYWYDPDPRTILPFDQFHVPRRLARTARQRPFEIRVDTAFEMVMRACAEPVKGRETTWINEELIQVYTELHQAGYAHSLESWRAGELVGGLYGVSLRGLFAGESMFSRETDASKIALVHLIERLKQGGFTLLDTQFTTPHLQRFGVVEVSRRVYKALLAKALQVPAEFGH